VELMSAEQWEKAAEEFKAAIGLDPLMALAYYNLGQCRMAQKRFVEAVVAYQGCKEAFDKQASLTRGEREQRDRARRDEINELRDQLRNIQQLKNANIQQETVKIEDRIRMLEAMQGRDLAGGNNVPAEVFLAMGSAFFRQQKLADAEREYLEAVRLNSKLGAAHNNLAVIYLMTGRAADAEASIKLAEKNGVRVNPRLKDDIKAAIQKKL
jgi:tetratricopeptide (TPR) repeat protein